MTSRYIAWLLPLPLFLPLEAQANELPSAQPAASSESDAARNCTRYRAKRADVPIYRKPDTSSEVLHKLLLGQEVCYVGEQEEFVILDWQLQSFIDETLSKSSKDPELAFAKSSDLWPPQERGLDLEQSAREIFESMGYGGQPDDVFAPVRALLYKLRGGPECLAGKICEKVKQDLERGEE